MLPESDGLVLGGTREGRTVSPQTPPARTITAGVDGFDHQWKHWLALREDVRASKAAKQWERVSAACDAVLVLATANPDLQIVGWMFTKQKANALAQLGRTAAAIDTYECAAAECERYRRTVRMSKPSDFAGDVETMRKRAASLRKKL